MVILLEFCGMLKQECCENITLLIHLSVNGKEIGKNNLLEYDQYLKTHDWNVIWLDNMNGAHENPMTPKIIKKILLQMQFYSINSWLLDWCGCARFSWLNYSILLSRERLKGAWQAYVLLPTLFLPWPSVP